ncbi:hypothetical protein BHOIPH791_07290 [Bartonella henselae]|nr:hypothetical protein BH623125_06380 [Bartonella henselae]GFF04611.1 hypothetical protein BH80429_14320 [Bartonella henselae]
MAKCLRKIRKMLANKAYSVFAKSLDLMKNTLANYKLGVNEPSASLINCLTQFMV